MTMEIPHWEKMSTDDARVVLDSVQRFASGPVAEQAAEIDARDVFPRELYVRLGQMGCLAPRLPSELGGIELATYSYCRLIFTVTAECAAIGNAIVSAGIAANYLYAFGKGRFDDTIRGYADGTLLPAMALTEAGSGSDLRSLRTSARPVDGGYLLNGEKSWITMGGVCDKVAVLARLPGESRDGLIALLLDADMKGFRRGKPENMMGMRGLSVSALAFDDVYVSEDRIIGVAGEGFKQTAQALSFGRILVASLGIGITRGVLRRCAEYALERKQFGKRLWEFQNTKFRIAELSARLVAVESLIARACQDFDAGNDPVVEASSAKLLATDLAMETAIFGVQLHGAVGYCKDFAPERFMRDAKITQIYEGTNEIQKLILAREIINAPRSS